jgi:hypothetical protein
MTTNLNAVDVSSNIVNIDEERQKHIIRQEDLAFPKDICHIYKMIRDKIIILTEV